LHADGNGIFRNDEPTLSSPQKLASPTFHTPPSSTATPVSPLYTDMPPAVRSYFTLARVGEVTVTEVTLAVTADASGVAENAVTALARTCPFWSNWTRLLFGVDELKNSSQLVLIVATVAAEPPDDELAVGVPNAVAVAAGAELEAGAEVELELLLEQAVIAAASARQSAGARKIRRPVRRNGIRCASLGRRRFMPVTS
jgi:hypothetical protein